MDRLLTDRDILDILEPIIEPEKVARLRANAEDLAIFTSEYCVVAITQDAKTLKAVAEWCGGWCKDPNHLGICGKARMHCLTCMTAAFYNWSEGSLHREKE